METSSLVRTIDKRKVRRWSSTRCSNKVFLKDLVWLDLIWVSRIYGQYKFGKLKYKLMEIFK